MATLQICSSSRQYLSLPWATGFRWEETEEEGREIWEKQVRQRQEPEENKEQEEQEE